MHLCDDDDNTGTPVQNNLHETYCLLNFLHPTVFDHSEKFDDCFSFDNSGQISVDRQVLDKAHYLLRPFVLRRVKTEVEVSLPAKVETLIECPMSSMQRFWSKRLLLKNSDLMLQLEKTTAAASAAVIESNNNSSSSSSSSGSSSSSSSSGGEQDTVVMSGANADEDDSGSWKKLQSLLAQLRKAANHPYLFPNAETISADPEAASTNEEIVTASGKMVILDQLLKKLKRKGHRVVLFSQYTKTLDIISDYLDYRNYSYSRLDGQTNRVYREVLINQFNRKKSSKFIFCLSTRAGGEGVNLYTADTVILFDSDWNPQVHTLSCMPMTMSVSVCLYRVCIMSVLCL
jgi:SWI/SNF-related matrix-associated actin-dependent regulator of chromatin subfamily A member 5